MIATYAGGNILPPMAENVYETVYFRRPALEQTLRRVLRPTFANEYYLINGDIGSGKTRTIVELTRELVAMDGARGLGAPVYVLASQGSSFAQTLANAVDFRFDEHISFQFFVDFVMRIHSMPLRDEGHRLNRVLDAIEESAFAYMQKTGRPVVIVIDGINYLTQSRHPGTLEKLQDKAKLWADTNIVKLVLVNNDEEMEAQLQTNTTSWARLATPIIVEDLSPDEAVAFLTSPHFMEQDAVTVPAAGSGSRSAATPTVMDLERARRIVDLVGGRILHLIAFRRDWLEGVSFDDTAEELKGREREKLFKVWRTSASWRILEAVLAAPPDRPVKMSELMRHVTFTDIFTLAKQNVIRYDRVPERGLVVTFRSTLTRHVVDEMQKSYVNNGGGDSKN
jgi:hypothetical protein